MTFFNSILFDVLMSSTALTSPPVEPPNEYQVVGSRGESMTLEGGNTVSTNNMQISRTRQYIGSADVSEIKLVYQGYWLDAVGEVNATNGYTIRANVEIDGVSVQVEFGGNRNGTVASGEPFYQSDALLPSDFGLSVFPAGKLFWVRSERNVVTGGKFMYGQSTSYTNAISGESHLYGGDTFPSQLDATGALTETNGWAALTRVWTPLCVIGKPVTKMMAVGVIGASIENGVGENSGDGFNDGGGYMRRSLASVDGVPLARISLAKSGESGKTFVSSYSKRAVALGYVTHAFACHGGNDYSGGESWPNTLPRLRQAWDILRDAGVPNVLQYALSPKTDSTDSWATVENQTPRWGYDLAGDWFGTGNATLAADVATDANLDGFISLAPAQVDATYQDRWKAPPTASIDGTHPHIEIHTSMATLNSQLLSPIKRDYEGYFMRLVARTMGPGNDGQALTAGTTAGVVSSNHSYTNESGAILTTLATVFSGFTAVNNAAEANCPVDYPITATVEYPVGGAVKSFTFGGSNTGTVPAGAPAYFSDEITLTTPIPIGATFKIAIAADLAVGQKVPMSRDSVTAAFRPSGIVSTLRGDLNRFVPFALGDSIFTNDGLPPLAQAAGVCPLFQLSMIGATLYQNVNNYTKRLALAKALGCTHAIVNYQTNDHNAGRTYAQMTADAASLSDQFAANDMKTIWTTGTPVASVTAVSGTNMSASGGSMVVTVPNGALFLAGQFVGVVGASPAAAAGRKLITAVNGNVLTLSAANVPDGAVTGTITINRYYNYSSQQTAGSGNFAGGTSSIWYLFSEWVRSHPGNIIDHIELTDLLAESRTVSKWKTVPDAYLRADKALLTVSSITSTTRFNYPSDGDTTTNNWCNGGAVIWLTGANAGVASTLSGNSGLQLILSSALSNIAIGDTFAISLGTTGRMSEDGTHPRVSYTWGGGPSMGAAIKAKLIAVEAAL